MPLSWVEKGLHWGRTDRNTQKRACDWQSGKTVSRTKSFSLLGSSRILTCPPRPLSNSCLIRHRLSPLWSFIPFVWPAVASGSPLPVSEPLRKHHLCSAAEGQGGGKWRSATGSSFSQQRQEPPGPCRCVVKRVWTNTLPPPGKSSSLGLAWALSLGFQL